MGDDAKSKEELLKDMEELRKQIAWFEAPRSGIATEIPSPFMSSKLLRADYFQELREGPLSLRMGYKSTESIELKSLFTRDITASGSFNERGGVSGPQLLGR